MGSRLQISRLWWRLAATPDSERTRMFKPPGMTCSLAPRYIQQVLEGALRSALERLSRPEPYLDSNPMTPHRVSACAICPALEFQSTKLPRPLTHSTTELSKP